MRNKTVYGILVISLVASLLVGALYIQTNENKKPTLPDLKAPMFAGPVDNPDKTQFSGELPGKDEVTVYKIMDRTDEENRISEPVYPKKPSEIPQIPSDKQCVRIARDYVEKVDWSEENLFKYEIDYATVQKTFVRGENKGDTFGGRIFTSVSLARKIDGVFVPEDRIRIRIGEEGKILKASKEWSNLKKIGLKKLKDPKKAIQKYLNRVGLPTKNGENIRTAIIKDVKVEFFLRRGYLRPFFKTEATAIQEDGDRYPISSIAIPAEKEA